MITANGDTFLRENSTDFTCNMCSGSIMYVQVMEKPMRLVADFFQCDRCGYKIETKDMQEEEFPAFYDQLNEAIRPKVA